MSFLKVTSPFGSNNNDRGASPVIATILLVAIITILAAISGTLVLGLVDDVSPDEPLASFQMNQNETTVVLTHTGGDSLEGENVYLRAASGGSLGNYAGTDRQACNATHDTINPGTECRISGAPTGELFLIWRSDRHSKVLFRGEVLERGTSPTSTPSSAESVEAVKTEGVDTQSSEIELVIENTGSKSVTIVDFAVDATAISNGVWIDNGNLGNPEFWTSGATTDGNADKAGRDDDSFLANGTTYRLENNNGENATLAATDDTVTVSFRAFGPDDRWIDDSDELKLVDNEADADVIVYLGLGDGSTAELYLQVV